MGAHLPRLRSSLRRGGAWRVSAASERRRSRAHRPAMRRLGSRVSHQTPRNLRGVPCAPASPAASSPLSGSPPSGEKPSGKGRGARARRGRPPAISHGDGDGDGAASLLPHSLADGGSGDGAAAGGAMPPTTAAAAVPSCREAMQLGVGGPSAPPQSSGFARIRPAMAQRVRRRRGGANGGLAVAAPRPYPCRIVDDVAERRTGDFANRALASRASWPSAVRRLLERKRRRIDSALHTNAPLPSASCADPLASCTLRRCAELRRACAKPRLGVSPRRRRRDVASRCARAA